MNEIKIIDKQNREVLNEGRNCGLGFAFLKKVDPTTFETVMPISPCKDYLNDVLYTEYTGKGCSACGLNYPKKLDIEDNGKFYMIMKVADFQNKIKLSYNKTDNGYFMSDIENYKVDIENLNNNNKIMQNLINQVELDFKKVFPINYFTEITACEDNIFLISFDKFWCNTGYLISLFTLYLRSFMYCNDDKISYEQYIFNMPKIRDKNMVTTSWLKFCKIRNGMLPDDPYDNIKGSPHGLGIQHCQML